MSTSSPWAVILCKFTDGNDEPFPMQYLQRFVHGREHGFAMEHDPVLR